MSHTTRIARNTLALYFRQILIMLVSLYTVRVVLATLGAEDYGIYNVVAGVVTMFGFLSGSLAGATQRYLSFELGRGDFGRLQKVFSLSLTIYVLIAAVVLALGETAGVWFVRERLVMPAARKGAALWVFQASMASFLFSMITTPYMAAVTAHEEMKIYAYIAVIEAALKLAVALALPLFPGDTLRAYAVLLAGTTVVNTAIYRGICAKKFAECRLSWYWDYAMFKEIFAYSGWSLFGGAAWIGKNQGITVLLNLFFGPAVNAARGVASQANTAITVFSGNFMQAVYPQIVKTYAAGDTAYLWTLMTRGSKLNYYLLYCLSVPALLETDWILTWWLGSVPAYASLFLRLSLLEILITSFTYPLAYLNQATGNIALYQVVVGLCVLAILPLSAAALRVTGRPEAPLVVGVVIAVISLALRVAIVRRQTGFPVRLYARRALLPAAAVSALSPAAPLIIHHALPASLGRAALVLCVSLACSGVFIWFLGLTKEERTYMAALMKKIKQRETG